MLLNSFTMLITLRSYLLFSLVFFFCLFLLPVAPSFCEEIDNFYLEIKPRSGTIEDRFNLGVVIEGTTKAPVPELTAGQDFDYSYSGPETRVEIENGEMRQSVIHHFILTAKREGELLTPGAAVIYDGRKYVANALKLSVSKNAATAPDNSVMLEQHLDKAEAYLGEQVVNTVEFISNFKVIGAELDEAKYDGFWYKEFERQRKNSRIISGEAYNVTSIKTALFPLRAGNLELAERAAKAKVQDDRPSNRRRGAGDPFGLGIFNDFFPSPAKELNVRSSALLLKVLTPPTPLYEIDEWGLSSPIVGATDIKLNYDSKPIKYGEGKTLEFTISSFGNINPLTKIPLKIDSSQIKVYEESPAVEITERNGRLLFYKRFKLSLIPLHGNQINIPAVELPYFDTESKSYKTSSSAPISFTVEGAPVEPTPIPRKIEASSVAIPEYDEPIRESIVAASGYFPEFSFSVMLLGVLTLLIALVFSLVLFIILRAKQARLKILKRLKQARDFSELNTQFLEILRSNFDLKEDLSVGAARSAIHEKVTDEALKFSLVTAIDQLQLYLYGQTRADDKEFCRLREEIASVVNLLGVRPSYPSFLSILFR